MRKHISIDCESLGQGPAALLLSVAAVAFDPLTGVIAGEYEALIEHPEGFEIGTIDLPTVLFWMRQPDEARRALFDESLPRVSLRAALLGLFDFIRKWRGDLVWQRGDKDTEWLKSAARSRGMRLPWNFWQVRDVRTLAKVVQTVEPPPHKGPKHRALTDAHQQAQHVAAILSRLDAAGLLLKTPCGQYPII